MTTWLPGGLDIKDVLPIDAAELSSLEDRIDFLFNGYLWAMKDYHKIYIGVYNSNPEEGAVEFTVRMREYSSADTFSNQVSRLNSIF